MACRVCTHPKVTEIDHRLASGETLDTLAARYRLNRVAIHRHRHNCKHKVRWPDALAIRAELTPLDPAQLTDASAPLRQAAATRPTADDLLTLSSHLVAVAASRAIALGDPAAMLACSREAREVAKFDLETVEQRAHTRRSRRGSPMAVLENLLASEAGEEQARALLGRMPPSSRRQGRDM